MSTAEHVRRYVALTHCTTYLVQVLVERLQVCALCQLRRQIPRLADDVSRPGLAHTGTGTGTREAGRNKVRGDRDGNSRKERLSKSPR